jgi:hypothetical protein
MLPNAQKSASSATGPELQPLALVYAIPTTRGWTTPMEMPPCALP